MAELEGFVDDGHPGVIRVHAVDDPRRYRQVAIGDVAGFRDVTEDPVANVVLHDDAEITGGLLDEDAFQALLTSDPATGAASVRDRETAYPRCYSWNPPGGGGFCLKQPEPT
jgi:hypothetical protein